MASSSCLPRNAASSSAASVTSRRSRADLPRATATSTMTFLPRSSRRQVPILTSPTTTAPADGLRMGPQRIVLGSWKVHAGIAQGRFVVDREQQRSVRYGRTRRCRIEPVRHAVHGYPLQALRGSLGGTTCLDLRERCPAREVTQARRPVTGIEAPRQLTEIAGTRARIRRPLRQQRVRLLGPTHRPAADQSLELGIHDHVRQPEPVRDQPFGRQRCTELGPGPVLPAAEQLADQLRAAIQRRGAEPLAPVHRPVQLLHPSRCRGKDPADILCSHQVPGRPQDMSSQHDARIELRLYVGVAQTRRTHAERPERMCALLRLHAGQQPYDVSGVLHSRPSQPLGREPPA